MLRRIVTALSALSLVLLLAVLGLWVRSYRRWDSLEYYNLHPGSRGWSYVSFSVFVPSGALEIIASTPDDGWASARSILRATDAPPCCRWTSQPPSDSWAHAMASPLQWGLVRNPDEWEFGAPLWAVAVIFAPLPALVVLGRWRRARWLKRQRRRGLCLHCGYDLRTTPGRCPECGAAATTLPPSGRPLWRTWTIAASSWLLVLTLVAAAGWAWAWHSVTPVLAEWRAAHADDWAQQLRGAAERGHIPEMQNLLDLGAPIDGAGHDGQTALAVALTYDQWEAAVFLVVRGASARPRDLSGHALVYTACNNGNLTMVAWLLEHGAPVDQLGDEHRTALWEAVLTDAKPRMLELLLDHGADPESRDAGEATVLYDAAGAGNVAAVRLLLAHGAKVNVVDANNTTPLAVAASGGHTDIMQILLEHGADVNAAGGQAIRSAPLAPGTVAVEMLLAHGADVNPSGGAAETPLGCAAGAGNAPVLRLLLARGARVDGHWPQGDSPLLLAARGGHAEACRVLLAAGADIHAHNWQEETPLHRAARALEGGADVARELVAAGADVNAPDRDGQTPLHVAAWAGNTAVAKVLLDHGANVNATDDDGNTPLAGAHHVPQDLVNLLLAHGARQ